MYIYSTCKYCWCSYYCYSGHYWCLVLFYILLYYLFITGSCLLCYSNVYQKKNTKITALVAITDDIKKSNNENNNCVSNNWNIVFLCVCWLCSLAKYHNNNTSSSYQRRHLRQQYNSKQQISWRFYHENNEDIYLV